ncbi:hypothetical protein Dtox_0192 [Desulfofarcimen acetoxidans DSM 771]|uniref:Uncharacterized protein n=1 Tax=Desulfofarcimen acetoxidans (strain ATCC 49208 / DSM 771 / KCTC 5769 / VKM B-1644 / 5575) TaxID=485916 RepID=C8W2Y9_DESAS|nr:hypothetical protein [Desulfofarcimen acetoxidans]ACV61145.1 hypothetical protein Dtox_0192 [Desulfofarcimen acetoxidans DSM 771]
MANSETLQEVALVLLGTGIPAIGPKLQNKKDAEDVVRSYVLAIHNLIMKAGESPYKVLFQKQEDGRYSVLMDGSGASVKILTNLDELMLRRFRHAFQKNMFILTSFCEEANGCLECLALTEGLGAVLYAP